MVLTMAAVAGYKGIALRKAEVRIEPHVVEGTRWQSTLRIGIDLGEGLSRREQKILFNSARLCEVHKILTGDLRFEYRLLEVGPGPSPGKGIPENVRPHVTRRADNKGTIIDG